MPTAPAQPPAQPTPGAALKVESSTLAIRREEFGFAQARHLLWRAGFGGTPRQIQTLVNWGPAQSVDYLLSFDATKEDDAPADRFANDLVREPTASERQAQRQAAANQDENTLAEIRLRRQKAEQADREQSREMQRWWLQKMIESPRPLHERLVLMWHGHFATSYRTIEHSYNLYQQNRLFRKHAAGDFRELLRGIIHDPAMLKYLSNNLSRKDHPNENLARELMELFSLGVGRYSENDIKEGARALTGYTFKDSDFVFEKHNHDTNPKTILGQTGNFDGDAFVDILLDQPACARFIATKLYRFFAADYPTGRPAIDHAAQSVIGDVEKTLRSSKYSLGAALKRLFLSKHFYDRAIMCEQIKSPVQLVVGTIRAFNTPARSLGDLNEALAKMGQEIFYPPSVKGWDGGRSWINSATMFIRQNASVYLLTGRKPGGGHASDEERFDSAPLLAQLTEVYPQATGGSPAEIIDALLTYALGHTSPAGKDVLLDHLQRRGGKLTPEVMTELMLLITAMPEYQLC